MIMGVRKTCNKIPIIYAFCLALSFVCITINSKFSFLYTYHDVGDVQCFITVARCMLRGDVLYRDVYENKGPLHYFLYYIGIGTTGGSTIGVYVIEIILFSVFLFAVYRTIELFCKYSGLNYVLTTVIGVCATVRQAFGAGGECEELTLPFVAIALYFALKENTGEIFAQFRKKAEVVKRVTAEKNSKKVIESAVIGLSFSIVFWSKYTITGVFAGYVFAVLLIGLINKDAKYIAQRALGFTIGAIMGTIPVIIYFDVNNAFSDLWEAYFYNLIFKYIQNDYGETDFWQNLSSLSRPWLIIAMIGVIAATKQTLKKEGKIYAVMMTLLSLIGLSIGKVWGYVHESVVPFGVLVCVGIVGIIERILCAEKIRTGLMNQWEKFKVRLDGEMEEKQKLKNGLHKLFVEDKPVIAYVFIIMLVMYAAYVSFTVTPYYDAIGAEPKAFAIIRVSEKLKELVPKEPVILNFTSVDTGLYSLTDTYPPDKFFCRYNLFTPREMGYYEKYLETGKADFVMAYKPIDDLEEYGYELYYKEENVPKMDSMLAMPTWSYYLYVREDLIH